MGEVPSSPDSENPEIDFKNLKFGELEKTFQEIRNLAATTFHQTEDGFINALGDGIGVGYSHGGFRVRWVSETLRDVHFLCTNPNSPVFGSSPDKQGKMLDVKAMLEKLGKRVIE